VVVHTAGKGKKWQCRGGGEAKLYAYGSGFVSSLLASKRFALSNFAISSMLFPHAQITAIMLDRGVKLRSCSLR